MHNELFITYNAEMVFPNDECRGHFMKIIEASRNAYNECASIIYNNNIALNIKSVHNAVYTHIRNAYPILTSNAVIAIYRNVISAIRSIKTNRHLNSRVPKKKQLSHKLNRFLYNHLTANGIWLTSNTKRVRSRITFKTFPRLQEMFKKYIPGDPTIFIRKGKFYTAIPFKIPKIQLPNNNCIGIDMGERRFAVTSDGIYYHNKKYNANRRKIRYLKRCLQKKGTRSANKHLHKLAHTEQHHSTNVCNHIANAIINSTRASILVLEDLSNIKKNTSKSKTGFKKKTHNRRIYQIPFFKFKQILSYKALLAGKRVETVSPYLTSQIDCTTGKRAGTRKNRRFYCNNGVVLDADWNAAVNIAKKSNHPFSYKIPKDGTLCTCWAGCMPTTQSHYKSSVET